MKIGTELIWLSDKDVEELLTMEEALSSVEQAFQLLGSGQAQLPSKIYLTFEPHDGDLRAMPAYLKGNLSAAGVKIVNSNPSNPQKKLPAVTGVMVLNDPETGLPLAIMTAGALTAIRTGAAGGVAAKFLAKKNAETVGLIGCGRQAKTQLEAVQAFFNIKKVLVWGKMPGEAQTFCEKNQPQSKANFVLSQGVEEACEADILVTTTPVREPIIQKEWVKPGTHINAIGADAPGKQELDTPLLQSARVYVDGWDQASHAGEINVPVTQKNFSKEKLAGELGDVIAGKKSGRQSDRDITIFDSTGLAIQDVAVAKLVLDKALKSKKGQVLKLNG